ncbi:SUMO1 sentrin specific peptidase 1 [Halocaridina rubra]|uniref:SUMO1 sentrin specific peptidase 1 n=1 Tax=Halocaridina rubra TaxID=373956 RepID=A0AAN8WNN6_HALRR
MISAVTSKFKEILGHSTYLTEPRKRSLEESSSEDEVVWVGEGEPAPKKRRPLLEDDSVITRSYSIVNHNTLLKGTAKKLSNIWSWMSSVITPSIPLEAQRRRHRYDNDIEYLGMTHSSRLKDGPKMRPPISRTIGVTRDFKGGTGGLSSIDKGFRFSPSLTSTVSKNTFGAAPKSVLSSRSFSKHSSAEHSIVSPVKPSSYVSSLPVKRLHGSTKYSMKNNNGIFNFAKLSGRGRSCVFEAYRHEDKQEYRKLLQQYANHESSPFPIFAKSPSYSSVHSNSRSTSPQSIISRTQLSSKWTKDVSARILSKPASFSSSPRILSNGGLNTGKAFWNGTSPHSIITLNSQTDSQKLKDSEDDCVIIAEEIKAPSRKSSLEWTILESPVFHKGWQKDLENRFNTRARLKQESAKKVAEQHRIYSEVRKQSRPSLEERIANRLKQLDLCYATKIEEIKDEKEDEKDEEEELPELTSVMIEVIEDALDNRNPGQVLADKFNIQITRRDIATLAGLNWLNDEVINFYMNLLMERGKNFNYLNVYAFNTFFYPKLVKMGYSSVRRWTKKVDIFSHDLLLVPVHLGMHWCLATIDFRTKHIRYYDSMLGDNEKCLEALVKYLESEHQDKKQSSYDTSGWTLDNVKNIPQQMNGSDCGMFACKFSEYLSRDAKITFDQQHMPYFRQRMIYEIVSAKLM